MYKEISSKGFYVTPVVNSKDPCSGCYWESIRPGCLYDLHTLIDNELPECGREAIVYKHIRGKARNLEKRE